jgi:hypothetical protein
MPIPAEPAVLSVHVSNSKSATDIPVYVPWKNCRLVHAVAYVTTHVDTAGAMEIDLELNAASGTEMMSISVPADSAVGTAVEATTSSASACQNLDRDDANRDAVNIEVDGGAGTGAVALHLYFESERGQ